MTLRPHVRRLGGNVGWLIANRLIRLTASVIILGAVGRFLGPEEFGRLNYAIGLATIFATVANLGFEGIVIRELVRKPEATGEILATACFLRFLGGLAAIGLVGGSALLAGDPSVLPLALIVALAFLPGALDVIELWFQKNTDARSIFWARTGATVMVSIFRIALIYSDAPTVAFAWTQSIEAAMGAIGLIVVFASRARIPFSQWRASPSLARRLIRDSWPLILSGVLIAVYARSEQLLVKEGLGDYTLGVYYAAVRAGEMWAFLPPVLLITIFPTLVANRDRLAPADFQKNLQLMFDLLTGLGFLVAITITVSAPFIIRLVFGPQYLGAVPILIIQAWTAPILFSGAARAQYFLLENLNIYHTYSAIIGIALNVGLSLWWMRLLGAEGAALAALASAAVSGFGTSFLFPSLRTAAYLQARAFLVPFRVFQVVRTLRTHL